MAAGHGVEVQVVESKGMEAVLTATLVLLGSPVAVGMVTYNLDRAKGGQVIDLRPGMPRTLYRSKDVLYGLIVIYAVDGRVSIEVKEPRGLFGEAIDAVVKVLAAAAGSGTHDVADTVKSAIGQLGSVSVEPETTAE